MLENQSGKVVNSWAIFQKEHYAANFPLVFAFYFGQAADGNARLDSIETPSKRDVGPEDE